MRRYLRVQRQAGQVGFARWGQYQPAPAQIKPLTGRQTGRRQSAHRPGLSAHHVAGQKIQSGIVAIPERGWPMRYSAIYQDWQWPLCLLLPAGLFLPAMMLILQCAGVARPKPKSFAQLQLLRRWFPPPDRAWFVAVYDCALRSGLIALRPFAGPVNAHQGRLGRPLGRPQFRLAWRKGWLIHWCGCRVSPAPTPAVRQGRYGRFHWFQAGFVIGPNLPLDLH